MRAQAEPDDVRKLTRLSLAQDVPLKEFDARLEQAVAAVEDSEGTTQLVRTPSAQRDIDQTLDYESAARAQRLRAQVRLLDAEIAELRYELMRGALIRGPTGKRHTCDGDCVVGGCGEEFAEEEGVLCACGLFLCHPCFGATVVKNECQIGGRYDQDMENSGPGSLPCALFPQSCSRGHISLHTVQRAMLHRRNRGRDGEEEDVNSPGNSPHKTHLLARRRWAEAQVKAAGGDAPPESVDEGMLVRTFTERARESTGPAALGRGSSRAKSILADKLNEVMQLKRELAARPIDAVIPRPKRRTCAQCNETFASFEGGQCLFMRHSHFLCSLCFGGYIMRACSEGGVFEQEIRNEAGVVISARGQLPCPFFEGHESSQLVPRSKPALMPSQVVAAQLGEPDPMDVELDAMAAELGIVGWDPLVESAEPEPEPEPGAEPEPEPEARGEPALDCHCGAVPQAQIENILLDPRNASYQFWRERHADTVIQSNAASKLPETIST
eukprot:COSAG04_NODE_5462_length_1610_cov_1.245533_1_plen_497_part_01